MARSSQNYNTALVITLGIFILGGFAAYQNGASPVKVDEYSLHTDRDNPNLTIARSKVKSTLDDFITALQESSPQHRDFSVLIPIESAEGTHHLWLHDVTYAQAKFTGTPGESSNPLHSELENRDSLSISADQVADWIYVDDGKIIGAHFIKAMRDQLSLEERREYDMRLNYRLNASFD